MKRFVVFAVLLAMFTSCSTKYGYEVDWAPLAMRVYLHDTEGNNLLDETSEHHYDLSKTKIIYQGEEYSIALPEGPSREPLAYLARFKEPRIDYDSNGKAYLQIGEWDRTEDWDNCYVEIVWSDGTSDKLSFTHTATINWKHVNNPKKNFGYTFTTEWYLNGEPNGSWRYDIVK